AAALLREYLLCRDEPEVQLFAGEVFDALAIGFSSRMRIDLDAEIKIEKRVESPVDLLKQLGSVDTAPDRKLCRRLPAEARVSVRRAVEWSFGPDARWIPLRGNVYVTDAAGALEYWQK